MREIQVKKWKEGEQEASLLSAINVIIASKKPSELPRGIDKFRIFGRIGRAFDAAEESAILRLEETDYMFLKDIIMDDIPSQWALNKDISDAVNDFLDAEKMEER